MFILFGCLGRPGAFHPPECGPPLVLGTVTFKVKIEMPILPCFLLQLFRNPWIKTRRTAKAIVFPSPAWEKMGKSVFIMDSNFWSISTAFYFYFVSLPPLLLFPRRRLWIPLCVLARRSLGGDSNPLPWLEAIASLQGVGSIPPASGTAAIILSHWPLSSPSLHFKEANNLYKRYIKYLKDIEQFN